jgi:hypothetical protein
MTLTIYPGATIKFAAKDGDASGTDASRVELIVKGTLIAASTSSSEILGLPTFPGIGVHCQKGIGRRYAAPNARKLRCGVDESGLLGQETGFTYRGFENCQGGQG